jgi:hypothetical protein
MIKLLKKVEKKKTAIKFWINYTQNKPKFVLRRYKMRKNKRNKKIKVIPVTFIMIENKIRLEMFLKKDFNSCAHFKVLTK